MGVDQPISACCDTEQLGPAAHQHISRCAIHSELLMPENNALVAMEAVGITVHGISLPTH